MRAVPRWVILVLVGAVNPSLLSAGEPANKSRDAMPTALALVEAKRYPEASAVLEKIVAAEPTNAAACHQLGLVLKRRNDPPAREEALKWLAKAVELQPNNAIYLGDFGGTSLQFADRTHSLSAATKGRDAMEQAIRIDPDYLDAREGLFHFYARAPWPLGSATKAAQQLEEIRRRAPELATSLSVTSRTDAKDYASAFQLCEGVLAKRPDDYTALYQYGRTASVSGQNLERGLAYLQRCLQLEPPTPAAPTHAATWQRLASIYTQLHRPADAKAAYQQALEIEPGNEQVLAALAKLQ